MKITLIKPDVYQVDNLILSKSGVEIAMQTPERLPKGLKKIYEQFLKEIGKEAHDARKTSKTNKRSGEPDPESGGDDFHVPQDQTLGEGGD